MSAVVKLVLASVLMLMPVSAHANSRDTIAFGVEIQFAGRIWRDLDAARAALALMAAFPLALDAAGELPQQS